MRICQCMRVQCFNHNPYIIQCSLDITPTWGFDKSWHYMGVALYGGGDWGSNPPK